MPTLITIIQQSLEVVAMPIKGKKEIKGIQNGKEKLKLSLSADDLIFTPRKS